ncbi:subclass B3 metallo-beta-lactamase [Kordiimonas aquimaris]|uniref:subclass B3 metallo-beta-lactamase n=1 Tax=Kordiimonas aquimaris TaxID=707591 RepID=UPI0021CE9F9A|nr:subclass B3 metallo-beta-lactamase [Kordiimonas aquimaris]
MIKSHSIFSVFLAIICSSNVLSIQNGESATTPWDQWGDANPSWVENTEPFRIIGNIYFVGTKGLSSFLISSSEGHILIDGGLPQNAPIIAGNITALGFNIKDVKILLNSHAHFDHSGGLRDLKEMSGAKLLASTGDRSALEGGFYLGYEDNINYSAPPVEVDEIINDGDLVTLGDIALKTSLTPGHTRGCTSWTTNIVEAEVSYEVLFFCGATVAGNTLVPEQYAGIVDDYRRTFEKTAAWQPDVMLVNHPFFFDMDAKREKQKSGDPLAFVDPEDFPKFMENLSQAFEQSLAQATAEKTNSK